MILFGDTSWGWGVPEVHTLRHGQFLIERMLVILSVISSRIIHAMWGRDFTAWIRGNHSWVGDFFTINSKVCKLHRHGIFWRLDLIYELLEVGGPGNDGTISKPVVFRIHLIRRVREIGRGRAHKRWDGLSISLALDLNGVRDDNLTLLNLGKPLRSLTNLNTFKLTVKVVTMLAIDFIEVFVVLSSSHDLRFQTHKKVNIIVTLIITLRHYVTSDW